MPLYPYLVSWPDLVAEVAAHPDEPAFPLDAEENAQPWLENGDLWSDSHHVAYDVSQVYERLRSHLPPAARERLDKLFGAFFWTNEADGRYAVALVQELGEKFDPNVFAIAMRPTTVREYLDLWDGAAFERLRKPFWAAFPGGSERLADFAEFELFVGSWVEVLRAAVARSRGLVVSWF